MLLPLATACGPSKTTSSPAPVSSAPPDDGRAVCEGVMKRTRECKDLYVPALLRTRTRFDQPPGIAERYARDGEAVLLPIAREEFDRDWSDAGIQSHCDEPDAKEPGARRRIVDRERGCLRPSDDCAAFVACSMASLAEKWSPKPAPSSQRALTAAEPWVRPWVGPLWADAREASPSKAIVRSWAS